jgi:hypothetical protein
MADTPFGGTYEPHACGRRRSTCRRRDGFAIDPAHTSVTRLPALTITAQQIAAELTRVPALLHSLSVD